MYAVEFARIILGGSWRKRSYVIDPINGCNAGKDEESCKKPATIASKDF